MKAITFDKLPKPAGITVLLVLKSQTDDVLQACESFGWLWGNMNQNGLKPTHFKPPYDGDWYLTFFPDGFIYFSNYNMYPSIEISFLYRLDRNNIFRAPANNDGRSSCFWCSFPTKKVVGFNSTYDICPKCGK